MYRFLTLVFCQTLVISCSNIKSLFTTRLDDGTTIVGSHLNYRDGNEKWFEVSIFHSPDHSATYYRFYQCDTTFKLKLEKKKYWMWMLTNDENPEYPLTSIDRLVLDSMNKHLPHFDECYEKKFREATGYKLIDTGKH